MLCSGRQLARERQCMIQYLTRMHEEMLAWMKDRKCCCNLVNGDDQSIHNYLYYTGKLPFAKAIPNRMGKVNTVGVQAAKVFEAHVKNRLDLMENVTEWEQATNMAYDGGGGDYEWLGGHLGLTDKEGYLTQFDGMRSRVIHQYDRFGESIGYEGWIEKRRDELWP